MGGLVCRGGSGKSPATATVSRSVTVLTGMSVGCGAGAGDEISGPRRRAGKASSYVAALNADPCSR